ncbi:MAG: DNRLRE domain-containing protein [Ginsengibacter sp.]
MRNISPKILIVLFAIMLFNSCKKEDAPSPKPPVAKADNMEILQLPKDSLTLTGTGSGENKIVDFSWSQVSGPNVAIIVSPSASSTIVRGLTSGDYIFQFSVIDEKGLTGVDTVAVKVTPSSEITLSLQPANNTQEMALAGNTFSVDLSDPLSTELPLAGWTFNGDIYDTRGLIKFDLTAIPSNAIIVSAKFSIFSHPKPLNGDKVHANFGSDNAFLIQMVTSNWIPAQTNWTHQPTTTTSGQVELPVTSQPFLDLPDIDVSNLISEMVSSNQNYGFMMRIKNEVKYNSRIFCSSKFADASKHPKLVVVYKLN